MKDDLIQEIASKHRAWEIGISYDPDIPLPWACEIITYSHYGAIIVEAATYDEMAEVTRKRVKEAEDHG